MPEGAALAKYVKAYRIKNNLTQSELANKTGISKETISLIERMKTNPSLDTMQRLARFMGITVPDLLTVE